LLDNKFFFKGTACLGVATNGCLVFRVKSAPSERISADFPITALTAFRADIFAGCHEPALGYVWMGYYSSKGFFDAVSLLFGFTPKAISGKLIK